MFFRFDTTNERVTANGQTQDRKHLVVSVCLCVCVSVREHISGTAGPSFMKFFVQIPCGCG